MHKCTLCQNSTIVIIDSLVGHIPVCGEHFAEYQRERAGKADGDERPFWEKLQDAKKNDGTFHYKPYTFEP